MRATLPRQERASPAPAAAVVVQRAHKRSRQSAQQCVSVEATLLVWMVRSGKDFYTGIFRSMA
ncbi:hypothetical protein JOQ06_017079, partial [Pogonophryne albipinna]